MPDATTPKTATLTVGSDRYELELHVGTEGERAIDVSDLRDKSGLITLDPGYRNTGACESAITFIDPDRGVLRYRGLPIEEVADKCSFLETAHLLIYGDLPSPAQLDAFTNRVMENARVDPGLLKMLDGFPQQANPMSILSACINGLCGYHPEVLEVDYAPHFDASAAQLIGKVATLAAAIHCHREGREACDLTPTAGLDYTANLLALMGGGKSGKAGVNQAMAHALDLIFLLHADHEQNCSSSTCRMVGSSHANLFASCAAACCALWGPLHGGANVEIMNQLEEIRAEGIDPDDFLVGVKAKKYRLFGFGHPIYKNYDPRARILKTQAEVVLGQLGKVDDPLLKIAQRLESVALADDYFVSRKLYPNVDFYSGIIMRALGVPTDLFTVLFAVGRMPGWIAQWKETRDGKGKIYRPRQLYVGPTDRHVPAGR